MHSQIEDITFGVELETTIPAAAQLRVGHYHAGLPVNVARAGERLLPAPTFLGVAWKSERDGSIRVTKPGQVACEFVSPILKGEAGVRHLVEFVEWLRAIGAQVNASCGMHIHIGAASAAGGEELTAYVERLTRLVAFNSKALYAQTGTITREKGVYCAPLGDQTKRAIARVKRTKRLGDAGIAGRYHILNLTTLNTRGTVEFRCFAGTVNTTKVLLHLFSALALAIIARKAKTPAQWSNGPLSGTKAVTNFLKVRPMARIVGSPFLTDRFPQMLAKAVELAGKYDTQQAALDVILLTRTTRSAA